MAAHHVGVLLAGGAIVVTISVAAVLSQKPGLPGRLGILTLGFGAHVAVLNSFVLMTLYQVQSPVLAGALREDLDSGRVTPRLAQALAADGVLLHVGETIEVPGAGLGGGRVLSSPPQGFCGSITTGYCATYELNKYGPPVTVASAIAISGAGLSRNSGTETIGPLVYLTTLLNLRLDYWTVGDIDYGSGEMGQLIYVKSSLTGDEPATILEYHASHPAFPQESCRNQFFTEGQVETYRALGMHIATRLLDSIRTFPWAVPASAPHEHATYADVAPAPGVPR